MTAGNDGGSSLARLRESSFPRGLLHTVVDERYRVVELIGAGAMGTVYRVEHLKLGTSFALKVLRPELLDDARMVERFSRESRAAASVVSEHVVPIVDSGTLPEGLPYFVMQLLPGSDLRALLAAQGPLTPARAVNLAIDACRGLAAAHAVGLVHRDLKPANLFVTRGDDGRDVVKILDFGVAKHLDSNTTRPGALIGTARYMAPEQIGLEVPVGPATDLFALGVIVYECIAGDVPFAGDTAERVLYKTMTADPIPLAERCPGLPPGLSEIVSRALQKESGPPLHERAHVRRGAPALRRTAPSGRSVRRRGPRRQRTWRRHRHHHFGRRPHADGCLDRGAQEASPPEGLRAGRCRGHRRLRARSRLARALSLDGTSG